MRMPDSLVSLADYGLIDAVIRPLMSGKEAQIYLVESQGEVRVAKVYREAEHRNFKHRSEYTEGRTTRNTRDQRAMAKRSRYGREKDEAAWRAAEVDMIYRLNDAGVRVPRPYHFIDGVLLMELVKGEDGEPAPRLGDLRLSADEAAKVYERLLTEVIRMLCAGVVHGDLSDFNVLMEPAGPVVIDFPQSVNASANASARKLLLRDVDNLHRFLQRFIPSLRPRPYAQEMWELYQRGELTPDTRLRGHFKASEAKVDTGDVLGLIREARDDAQMKGRGRGPRGERAGDNDGDNDGTPKERPRADGGTPHNDAGAEAIVRPRRVEVIITKPHSGRSGRSGPRNERAAAGPRNGRNKGATAGQSHPGQSHPKEGRFGPARGVQGRTGQSPTGQGRGDQDARTQGHAARSGQRRDAPQRNAQHRDSPQHGNAPQRGGADRGPRNGQATPFVGGRQPSQENGGRQPSQENGAQPRNGAEGGAPARNRRRRRKPRGPQDGTGSLEDRQAHPAGTGGPPKPPPQAHRPPPSKPRPEGADPGTQASQAREGEAPRRRRRRRRPAVSPA